MDTSRKRIIDFIDNQGITPKEFLSKTGLAKGFVDRSHQKSSASDVYLSKILEAYPAIDAEWLLTGKGGMLKEDSPKYGKPLHEVKHADNTTKSQFLIQTDFLQKHQIVPLYDIEASAGLVTLFNSDRTTPIDYISMPNLPKVDGALYITGDSMYPLLKSGDIVFYKAINNIADNLYFGEMYLLDIQNDGDDYTTVKYVHTSDRGSDWIKLVSQNQYHQPKDVHLSTVKAAAFVKASFRRNSMA